MNFDFKRDLTALSTSGVGSLPHANIDSALQFSFRYHLPFLPQLPAKNPHEFMIEQALEGLPGLTQVGRGEVSLTLSEWQRGSKKLRDELEACFEKGPGDSKAFEKFEPSASHYACWQPFLWELQERKNKVAKVQITGPLTSQWALKSETGEPVDRNPDIGTQIFRLVLARAMAMVRRLKAMEITPIVFLDEPGFYCYSKENARHVLGIQELRIFMQTLKKEGAVVGLHCCSNTDWKTVLSIEPDILSIDTKLSLIPLLRYKTEFQNYLAKGGHLALGVIPTAKGTDDLFGFEPDRRLGQLLSDFSERGFTPAETKEVLRGSLFTPACGLALHTVEDTEIVLSFLHEYRDLALAYTTA